MQDKMQILGPMGLNIASNCVMLKVWLITQVYKIRVILNINTQDTSEDN